MFRHLIPRSTVLYCNAIKIPALAIHPRVQAEKFRTVLQPLLVGTSVGMRGAFVGTSVGTRVGEFVGVV